MRQNSTESGRNPDLQTTGHHVETEDELDIQASKNESGSKQQIPCWEQTQDHQRNGDKRQVYYSSINGQPSEEISPELPVKLKKKTWHHNRAEGFPGGDQAVGELTHQIRLEREPAWRATLEDLQP